MRGYTDWILLAATGAICSFGPVLVQAQNDRSASGPLLEEVVVTAEKRAESIKNLPIAISAFSPEALQDRQVLEIVDLQRLAPSLQVRDINSGFTRVAIRGIGSEVAVANGDSPVGLSWNGVALANPLLLNIDFFDVERVEVLRGPQGTLGGRNATAGAIYTYSKRPTDTFEGGIKGILGNYGRLGMEGYLSGPVIGDRVLARIALQTDRDDGWMYNAFLDDKESARNLQKIRGSLVTHLSADVEATLMVDYTHDRYNAVLADNGRARPDQPSLHEFLGVPAFNSETRTVWQDLPAQQQYERYLTMLNVQWDIAPAVSLTSTSGYVDFFLDNTKDLDTTLLPVHVQGPNDSRTTRYTYELWQLSQEFTLTADLTDRLDMVMGALYLRSKVREGGIIGLPYLGLPPGSRETDIENTLTSSSGYMQLRYQVADKLRLTAGVRYSEESRDRSAEVRTFDTWVTGEGDGSWGGWMPKIAIDYQPNDDLTVYAQASRGFKSGGLDGQGAGIYQFDPEYVWNYEAGIKGDWFDRQIRTALTAFYMDYQNIQQSVSGIEVQTSQIVNAQSATIKGVELELDAQLSDALRVSFSGARLWPYFDELRTFDALYPELGILGPAGVNVRDLSGNQLVRAPKWSFNLSTEYTTPLNGKLTSVLRASYAWKSKVYFDIYNHETQSQDAYGLIDLSATVQTNDGAWELSAFVKNLADEQYISQTLLSRVVPQAWLSIALPGLPRTYGVSLSHRF